MNFSDLPEICKPFVLAILMLDDDYRPDVGMHLRPELILPVHEAFAAHLLCLSLSGMPSAREEAAKYLAQVERANLLQPAWEAFAWLKAHGHAVRALNAACKPPTAPLH